jgi:hypothetical protein
MGLTTDPNDPCLDETKPDGQQECYVVLSDEEIEKGYVRPVRRSYVHRACGTVTTMAVPIAQTYARDPKFYGGTFCAGCRAHFPLMDYENLDKKVPDYVPQFLWEGTNEGVGT